MDADASLLPRKVRWMKKKGTFVTEIACYSRNSL